jgi:hypothetical protein
MAGLRMNKLNKISLALIGGLILVGCSTPAPPPTKTAADQPGEVESVAASPTVPEPTIESEPGSTETEEAQEVLDLTQLWSYGLTSIRTGEPLITADGEHQLDVSLVAYGYNLVADKSGNILTPRGVPLAGGEQLIRTAEYQEDQNTREYAQIYSFMAPIRDTILYHFETTTKAEWLAITVVLTLNNLKTEDAPELNGRSILSTEQVYDYIAAGPAEGSPIMRYLEEAELELKCLAFIDFNFTNPEGANHCDEHQLEIGSGIKLP